MHVLASSCVFLEHTKQAYTCPGATLWTTGPTEDRFLKNILLFLSLLCACLLAAPSTSFFIYPQTGCIYHLRSLAALFFPSPVRELSFIFLLPPSHPVEKVAKPARFVLLNQGLFPHKISLHFLILFFLLKKVGLPPRHSTLMTPGAK